MSKLSIGQAWDEASAFLKTDSRLVLPVALAAFAAPTAIAGWAHPAGDLAGDGPGPLLMLAILIVAMIGQMVISGLAIGLPDSVGSLLGRAARRVWGMIAAAVLLFLPLVIIAVVVMGIILSGRGLTDPAQLTPEALARSPQFAAFVLVLLIAFLAIAARLVPLSAIAINESSRPIALLRRSWALTKGNFWRLLGLLMLLMIAALVLSAATTAVVGSVATLIAGEVRPFSLSALLIGLANGVVGAAVTAVSAAMVGRVYVQLSADPVASA